MPALSGQGTEVGWLPEHHHAIFDGLGWPYHLGICMDSCHLFAASFDPRTAEGVDMMLQAWDEAVGLKRIGCLHLNDSKTPLGARKDRHELLTQGHLGTDGIRNIVRHPFFQDLPICSETPVGELPKYAGEIALARHLAGQE